MYRDVHVGGDLVVSPFAIQMWAASMHIVMLTPALTFLERSELLRNSKVGLTRGLGRLFRKRESKWQNLPFVSSVLPGTRTSLSVHLML